MSDTLDPDEITAQLGMVPTRVVHKGARRQLPSPRPRKHIWEIDSTLSDDARVGDHISHLLELIGPSRARVQWLLRQPGIDGALSIERNFTDGVGAVLHEDLGHGQTLERTEGCWFGFSLDEPVVQQLSELGLSFNVAEYAD